MAVSRSDVGRTRHETIDPRLRVFHSPAEGGGSVTRARDAAVQLGCARSRALALLADAVPERSPRTRDQPTGDGNSSHSHGSSWDRFQTELLPAAPVPPAKQVAKWPPGAALIEAPSGVFIRENSQD